MRGAPLRKPAKIDPANWKFGDLRPYHYRVILADPAWEFKNYSAKGEKKHAKQHYRTASLGEICNLPVYQLADPRGAIVVIWSTWAFTVAGHHLTVMRRWGFAPSSGGAWVKVTRNSLPAFGTGYVLRDACEPFFIGRRGRFPGLSKSERNLIISPRRRHSEKPVEMYEMLERLGPGPRCELFARPPVRPGWHFWGDEIVPYYDFAQGDIDPNWSIWGEAAP